MLDYQWGNTASAAAAASEAASAAIKSQETVAKMSSDSGSEKGDKKGAKMHPTKQDLCADDLVTCIIALWKFVMPTC